MTNCKNKYPTVAKDVHTLNNYERKKQIGKEKETQIWPILRNCNYIHKTRAYKQGYRKHTRATEDKPITVKYQ